MKKKIFTVLYWVFYLPLVLVGGGLLLIGGMALFAKHLSGFLYLVGAVACFYSAIYLQDFSEVYTDKKTTAPEKNLSEEKDSAQPSEDQ